MSKSDILDNFFKIAQEKGLISDDAPAKAKKILEKTHRADSLSIDDIAKLYNIKSNMDKGNAYSRNIIENAHPKSYIASPSYDKLNGLVENENERQDITLNILNKTPTGNLTQHKYAKRNLILSLVRVANDLDNNGNDKLRILADVCLSQASKQSIKKEAVLGFLIVIPVVLAALYAQQHLSLTNDGFEKNHQKLISELDDITKSSSSWGVGYDYKSDFINMIQDFKNKLMSFYSLYKKASPIISSIEKPRTAKELIELSKQPQTDTVVKAYGALKSAIDNMSTYMAKIEKNFASETYKGQQIEDKGILSSIVDKVQVLHGGKGLVADDFDDVIRAITPYKKSIFDMLDILQKAESIEKSAQQQITESNMTPQAVTPDVGSDFNNKIGDLEKDLGDGLS